MKYLISLPALLALSGCALTLSDIRNMPPEETNSFNANYEELGSCVAENIQSAPSSFWVGKLGNLSYQVLHRKNDRRYLITGNSVYEGERTPVLDLAFIGESDNKTLVEYRWGGLKGGGSKFGQNLKGDLLSTVNQCSAASTGIKDEKTPALTSSDKSLREQNSNSEKSKAARLAEISDLRAEGLITEKEYKEMRNKILSNI